MSELTPEAVAIIRSVLAPIVEKIIETEVAA